MNETVFVVDDDRAMRESLAHLLESAGYAVETYASGSAFLEDYDGERGGCLLLDLAMPDLSGIEVQQALKQRHASIPIIFLSGHGTVSTAVEAVKSGALDFVEKPVAGEVLLEQVECAVRHARQERQGQQDRLQSQRAYKRLSPREREVMRDIVSGLTNKQIARKLDLSPRTVEVHRRAVMQKMGVNSLAELVQMANHCPPASDDTRT